MRRGRLNRSKQKLKKPTAFTSNSVSNNQKNGPEIINSDAVSGIDQESKMVAPMQKSDKHWLDYTATIFAFIAAIAGILAGWAGAYQACVAKDSEIISNRAYVISNTVRFITYSPISSNEREWELSPLIENVGNTQTKNLQYVTSQAYCVRPSKQAFDQMINWNDPKQEKTTLNTIIGPKSEVVGATGTFSNLQVNCAAWGLVVGTAKYFDIFGKIHLTQFCTIIVRASFDLNKYPEGNPIRMQGAPCETHNCSDDECGENWKNIAEQDWK